MITLIHGTLLEIESHLYGMVGWLIVMMIYQLELGIPTSFSHSTWNQPPIIYLILHNISSHKEQCRVWID